MKLCAISFKECWQEDGKWYSYGGFPMQMTYLGQQFDSMTLIITEAKQRPGGILLPEFAHVVALKKPEGNDGTRKLYVLKHLRYYVKTISNEIKKADVIHTPLPGDIPLIAMIIAILKKKKLIARYGGSWENNEQTTIVSKFTKFIMKRFAGGKRVMLATGSGSTPPAKNMHWIFSSVLTEKDLSGVYPNLNRRLSETPELVYIGRLSSEKGVQVLLKAVHILKETKPNLKFRIKLIGGGPMEDELKAITKQYNIEDRVVFKGQLNKSSLLEEVQKSDLCVQPSLTEGFSKAWLDAFFCGLPIVASNVGAASSVITKDRGWLVKPNAPDELANRIEYCLTSEDINWEGLRNNCFNFVKELTIENWGEKIKQICDRQWLHS